MTLDFVCRTFTLEELLRCSFNLNKTELSILKYLLNEKEEKTIEEITKKLQKDRTTIQRSISILLEQELITRRQINLKTGGYIFIYAAKSKEVLKEKVYKIFESFKEKVDKEIKSW